MERSVGVTFIIELTEDQVIIKGGNFKITHQRDPEMQYYPWVEMSGV